MFVPESWCGEQVAVWHAAPSPRPALILPGSPPPPAEGAEECSGSTVAQWRAAIAVAAGPDIPGLLRTRPQQPAGCSAREWANLLLDTVTARHRLMAYESAQQVWDLLELSAAAGQDRAGVDEHLATELAMALGVAESTASRYLTEAADMVSRCPATLDALERGVISPGKASAICHGTAGLSAEVTAQVEADVLPGAARSTVPGLREKIAASVIRRDPDGADDRHGRARSRRQIGRHNEPDGMAVLWMYGTAQDVSAVHECVTALADAAKLDGDPRSIGERRVDALVDVCTDILDRGMFQDRPLPTTQRRRPQLLVTIPATALLNPAAGRGEVADLAGYGPITPAQARVIAADATWRRLVCDPCNGALLDYGRTTYSPPTALTDFVLTRDKTCIMPGCRQPAHRCDIDHREPFYPGQDVGGATSAENCSALCRRHHRAKDHGGYRLRRTDNGDYHWTTPLGRTYTREHTRLWRPPERRTIATDARRTIRRDDPPPF